MNYREIMEMPRQDSLYQEGLVFYGLSDMIRELRPLVEDYVRSFQLDFAYDCARFGRADASAMRKEFILFLRECGTYLLELDEYDRERRERYEENYLQWIEFSVVHQATGEWVVSFMDVRSEE